MTSLLSCLNSAMDPGIIRWQIDKAASMALPSRNWRTLLTPVQEAFRMNKNLVSLFFPCAYWHQHTHECIQSPPGFGIIAQNSVSDSLSAAPTSQTFSSWPPNSHLSNSHLYYNKGGEVKESDTSRSNDEQLFRFVTRSCRCSVVFASSVWERAKESSSLSVAFVWVNNRHERRYLVMLSSTLDVQRVRVMILFSSKWKNDSLVSVFSCSPSPVVNHEVRC